MTLAYEGTVARLRERVVEELGDSIESLVLYGSVARGEAHGESDIDILVVTRGDDRELPDRISRIRTGIDLDNGTLTGLVHMSRDELERYLELGSPFVRSVVKEGRILYDRGVFEKIRGSLASEG